MSSPPSEPATPHQSPPRQPTPRRTPLNEQHEQLGATFTEFAGWRMPLRYSGDIAEHNAVRDRAGLFDLTHMGEIRITGRQAADAMDYALLANASAIRVGRARYTMLCDVEGGVLDDLIVYRLDEREFLVVANAANARVISDALARRVRYFDAKHEDVSDDYALLAVQGPESAAILSRLTSTNLDEVRYFAGYSSHVAGADVLLARTGYTGEDGFELFTSPSDAPQVWQALLEAGDDRGLEAAGLACRDTLRLEAGMPLYGHELSTDLTPFDANLGRLVKLDKRGEFVGKDALSLIADKPRRRALVGLRGEHRRSPRHGYRVLNVEGTEVGTVTSGAPSPTLGHPIAMAYVGPEHAEPGTRLSVDIRGTTVPVTVVELPFYRRSSS